MGGLLLAACGSSGSGSASSGSTSSTSGSGSSGSGSSGSGPAGASLPEVGSTPSTIHLYSVATSATDFKPDGTPLTDLNAAPPVGAYFVDTARDYLGDHSSHGKDVVATDHIHCLFTAVSASSATAVCNGQIGSGGSMMYADNQTVTFGASTSSITLKITGGTGRFEGAQGTVVSANVGNSNDSDATITVSASGKGTSPGSAGTPALSASPQAVRLFGKSVTQDQFNADGTAQTDQNAPPAVGDYFVSTDLDYPGDHSQHGSAAVGSDHLVCVILSLTASGASVRCDGQLVFGDSMLLADNQLVTLSQDTHGISVSVTGGTGDYTGAKGKVVSTDVGGNSNDSDFDITLSK